MKKTYTPASIHELGAIQDVTRGNDNGGGPDNVEFTVTIGNSTVIVYGGVSGNPIAD